MQWTRIGEDELEYDVDGLHLAVYRYNGVWRWEIWRGNLDDKRDIGREASEEAAKKAAQKRLNEIKAEQDK